MKLTLTMIRGPQPGNTVTVLPAQTLGVGRANSSDLHVMDPIMSREHFRIAYERDEWRIWDLSSRNGTTVNDATVKMAVLKNGDVIAAGSTTFCVTLGDTHHGKTHDAHGDQPLSPPHAVDEQVSNRRTWPDT